MRLLQNRINLSLAVILSIAIVAAPSLAEKRNILNVKCIAQDGSIISGAKVEIQMVGTNKWSNKKSNREGTATFDKLEDGVYRLMSRQKGFAPAFFEYVILSNDTQQDITLNYTAGDEKEKIYWENPESIQKGMETVRAAIADLQANNYAEAIAKLQVSLGLYPSNPDGQYYLAIASIAQQKWDLAEVALNKASNLSEALWVYQSKDNPEQAKVYEEMNRRVQLLLRQFPAFELIDTGGALLQQKKYAEALEKYEEAQKLAPDVADTYYNIALCQARLKQFDEAKQSIQKAIQLRPGDKAYQDLEKQIAGFEQIAKAEQAQALIVEGDDLLNKEDFTGAVAKYEEACPLLQPNNQAKVMRQIGHTYAKAGQADQALAAYQKALQLDPENPEYTKSLALFYVEQNMPEEALNLYTAGAEGNAADEALFNLGIELAKEGNSEVAQLALEKAVQTNPQNAEAHYELGMLYYFSKENDSRATELFGRYLEIGKDKGHLDNANNFLVVIEKRRSDP